MKTFKIIIFLLYFTGLNAYSAGLANVQLFGPINKAVQLDTVFFILEWSHISDSAGEKVTYDLYLSADTNPLLFRSNLDPTTNGIIDVDGYEFMYETPVPYDNSVYPGATYFNGADTLTSNTTYYWKVIVKNESGDTSGSEIYSFTTYRENNPPTTPVLVSPSNGETNVSATPTFRWTRSTDADGDSLKYFIQLRKYTGSYQTIASNCTDTSYTVTSQLEDFTKYYWRVYVLDGYTQIPVMSSISGFTVENYVNDPPVVDALLSPVNGVTNNGFYPVKFKWRAFEIDNEPLRYDVYADQTSNPEKLIARDITSDSLLYEFDKYGTYFWKVVAKDTSGLTDTSAVYSFSCWEQEPDFAIEMVDLKDNNFDMGCDSVYYYTRNYCDGRTYISYVRPNESPKHNVTLDDYQIGKFEITNDQYCKFLNTLTNDSGNLHFGSSLRSHRQKSFPYKVITYKGKHLCLVFDMTQSLDERQGIGYEKLYDSPIMWNGTYFEVDPEFLNHPVRFMYYEGANMFANWAGQYRLPTEAEWENAAMGGNKSTGYKFSGSNNLSEVAVYLHNLCGNSTEPSTMTVGSLKPNEIGIYDMSGNVYEICSDIYSASYYSVSPRENPQNTTYSNYGHVQRGGSYNLHYDEAFRVKSRYYLAGAQLINSAGFRLAKSLNHYSVSFTLTTASEVFENATLYFNDKNYAFDANNMVTIENLTNGTYSYTISANGYVDAIGKVSVSNANVNKEVNLTTVSTGDVELMLPNNIRVYPNPSKGKFFIKYEGVATVSVYNAVGGKVLEKEMNNEIELSLPSKGLFFIVLKNNKETIATKIIITN